MPFVPPTVGHVFDGALARDPQQEALVTRSGRWTYAELADRCEQAAQTLRRLGVRAGDRVAATLPNDVDVVTAFHGAMRVGAIWVGINRALAAPEKDYLLHDSGAAIWLTTEAVDNAPVRTVDLTGEEWSSAWAAADVEELPPVAPLGPAGIAYTSGTTGFPKGAVHSQHNLLVPGAALVSSRLYGPDLRKGDCFPLTILNMQVLTTLLTAQAGGCAVIMDRIDAAGVTEWIREERVSTWNGPPALLYSLATMDGIDPGDLRSLDEVWVGGADCPEALREAFAAKFGLPVLCTYGLSEAPTVVAIDGRDGRHATGGSGRPLPHLAVSAGGDGEITVAATATGEWAGVYRPMLGYWERDENPVVDGVLHTGDIGEVDNDGFLHIRDRKSLLIIRGGANVYPAEVERVLQAVPAVAASAVVGIADERLGERVVAAVELRPGATVSAEELRSHCEANLARYKVPERFVFVDAFERNSMGKIQRRTLQALFA